MGFRERYQDFSLGAFDPFTATGTKQSTRRAVLLLVTLCVVLALGLRTFTAARGLYAPLVVLGATALAIYYRTRVGVALAATAGVVSIVLGYVQEGFRGPDLILTGLAVPLWMVLVWAVGAFADALRRRDIELAANARELAHRAMHDPLTGLPNRSLFLDRLAHALARAKRQGTRTTLFFLDLDDFKQINDKLGHGAGDELLVEVGRRLTAELREMDTAARLGGDEFVVVCEDVPGEQDPSVIADRISSALQAPFTLADQSIDVGASIGVATSRSGDDTPADLLRRADAAMYRVKHGGKDSVAFDAEDATSNP